MELEDLRFVLNNVPGFKPEDIEECLKFYDTEKNGKLSWNSNLFRIFFKN
jgi:hypothetical protein